MAEQRAKASPEDLAKTLARAGVPQSVFFYVSLGLISTFRKCVYMAIEESCPPAEPMPGMGQPSAAMGQPATAPGQSPAAPGGTSGASGAPNVS
jgi:hypothetical protein